MKQKKIPFKEIFLFAFSSIALNMCASFLIAVFTKYALKPLGYSPFVYVLMWLSLIVIGMGVPIGILFYYYMRKRVAFQYQPSQNKWCWLKSACILILPGEILRFVLCLSKLGLISSFGLLGFIPSFLYEQTYLTWSGRMDEVRQWGNSIFADYLAFAICYLLYAAVYLGILLILYRHFWKKESTAYNEMLRHETDKRFY